MYVVDVRRVKLTAARGQEAAMEAGHIEAEILTRLAL